MADTSEVNELEDLQKSLVTDTIPISELHRLLDLHQKGTLREKPQTIDEYLNSGVHGHRVVYYSDPIDMIRTRQQQGLSPNSIKCVKTSTHEFNVSKFNKELLKRATRVATRQRDRSTVQIRVPDKQQAKAIIDQVQEKLLTVEKIDKPAIASALLAASIETHVIKDEIIENLQAIGYIEMVLAAEQGAETSVSYKWSDHAKVKQVVTTLLRHHQDSVSVCCSDPQAEWLGGPDGFLSSVKVVRDLYKFVEEPRLEQLKPVSLLAMEHLEHMGKSRPKTLKSLENIIKPFMKSIFITPMNMIFAKVADASPEMKTIKMPFGDPPMFQFSLSPDDMFVVPWKTDDPTVTAKEAKKFYRMVFSNFKQTAKNEKYNQCRLADAEMKTDSVRKLQEWVEKREKGIESDCEKILHSGNALGGVLHYRLSCLSELVGLLPVTRENIYALLASMSNPEVTLSPQEVVKKLEELNVLKIHPDKVVFFVKKIRQLVNQVDDSNKKVTHYVSQGIKRYEKETGTEPKKETQ